MGAKITELPEVLAADVAAVDVTILSSIGEGESKKLTVAELAKALLALGGATAITPATISAQQNDYEPAGAAGAAIWRLSAASPGQTVTGLAGGFAGRVLVVANVGAYPILLKEESAASAEGNRIATGPNGGNPTLEPGALWILVYDGTLTRWVIAGLEKIATTTRPGLMSHTDKSKLDGIAAGAAALTASTPQPVGAAAVGVDTTGARADHVHAHGDQAGGSLHAVAVAAGASGFMTGADKSKLDALAVPGTADITGTTHELAEADDGATYVCTHADGCEVSVPTGLTPGLSARFVQGDGDDPVTVVGDGVTLRFPATFSAATAEQWSSLVITVLSSTEALVEGDLAPA